MSLADRVVAITAELDSGGGNRYAYGTGCLVAPDTVLTCAHVVSRASKVWVRFASGVEAEGILEQDYVGDDSPWHQDAPRKPDLALITLPEPWPLPSPMPLARVHRF